MTDEIEELLKLKEDELILELKKFPPKKRIELIKMLEERRKNEQERTEKLMKQSIEEMSIENMVSIEAPDEKVLGRDDTDEDSLEGQVKADVQKTGLQDTDHSRDIDYMSNIYDELKEIITSPDKSYESLQRAGDIYERIMNEKYTGLGESIKDLADTSRKMMRDLKGDYFSTVLSYDKDNR